jgi:N-acetylglucosamine-6-sulfatase
LQDERVQAMRTLLAVDEAVRGLFDALSARDQLDHTVVIFLTDNGFSFGEHRVEGKLCPYETCIRTPIAVRTPWAQDGTDQTLLANTDLAPTIADLAGVDLPWAVDGMSFVGLLRDGDGPARDGVLIEYVGDPQVPHWVGVRGSDFAYIRTDDGTVELYDLVHDPAELRNLASRPEASALEHRARASLVALSAEPGGG